MREIDIGKTSRKKLEKYGWKYSHNNSLDCKIFLKQIGDIEVGITLYGDDLFDGDEAAAYVDFYGVNRSITPNDLIIVGNELKKLEGK